MSTPRDLISNMAKAPLGATFNLPLLFSEPLTEKDMTDIVNLIIQKNVKQVKVTGMTALRSFPFPQYAYTLPPTLKWIFALPVAKIIFEFNDIDIFHDRDVEFMKKIIVEYIIPRYKGENLPVLFCHAKSPSDEVIDFYEDLFVSISLGERSHISEGSRIIMQRLYDLQFGECLIGLGEKHALAERKTHAHACYQVGIKRYDLLRQFVADNEDGEDYPAKLIKEIDRDLEKLACRIGMNFLMLDPDNSEFLFQAIHFFKDILKEDEDLDDSDVAENIGNCIAKLLENTKKLQTQGQITAAYGIHRRLIYTNAIMKNDAYDYYIFLLDYYNNPELLTLINKTVKELLAELIIQFDQIYRRMNSVEIKIALIKAKQLYNQHANDGTTPTLEPLAEQSADLAASIGHHLVMEDTVLVSTSMSTSTQAPKRY